MNLIEIEWDDQNCILNSLLPKKRSKGLDLRLYKSQKSTNLDNMSDKLIAVMGLMLAKPDHVLVKVLIGFLLMMSISPFKFKIMKGKGIDEIIDNLKLDQDEGGIWLEKSSLDKILFEQGLSLNEFDWFIEHNCFEIKDSKIIFRGNSIKSATLFTSLK